MARLRAGILGNIRGKVAGVVGSQWKDKNYIREYVKPANPQTALQTTHRQKMGRIVSFAKWLVGPVFNTYSDRFYKSMSGFNAFIKEYITTFTASPNYVAYLITVGKLSPLIGNTAVYTTGTGACVNTFDKNLGNNGADTDKVFSCVFDKGTGLWYFSSAEVDRSTETITVTCDTGLTATDLVAYIFAAQYVGTLVKLLSNSDAIVGEAA